MMISLTPRRRLLAIACSVVTLALAGCTGTGFNAVAGAGLDEGGFGEPTRQNMLAMTSSGEAAGYLGARFAAEVPTTINFAFGSAELDGAARAALDRQADFMRAFPEVRFSVYGHTDKVGSNASNERLGRARARAAVAYLGARGVSTARLTALVSYGETRPLVPVQSPERANRRTVTEVSGFVAGDPLVLDGKFGQIVYRAYVNLAGTRGQLVPGGNGGEPLGGPATDG